MSCRLVVTRALSRFPRFSRSGRWLAAVILVAVVALTATGARAAVTTWQAGGDLLWENSSNWSGGLPLATDTAAFAGANLGDVDLNGTTRTIDQLLVTATGYSLKNGTLAANSIFANYDGRPTPLVISANVTDAGGAGGPGLAIIKREGDGGYVTISGKITVSSTAYNAFRTSSSAQNYGQFIFGSTNPADTNTVAGGVYLNDGLNSNFTRFQGTWTIGGDFQAVKGGNSSIQLQDTVTIAGNLANRTTNGNNDRPTTLQIMSTSNVAVGGDLIMDGSYVVNNGQCSILIDKPLKLQGNVNIFGGRLRLNVTDPILNYSTGLADTTKPIRLGDTSGTKIAQVEIDTNGITLNNPIIVQSGSTGAAILASGATGTGTSNKVTYAGAVTLNKPLSINAMNTAGAILDVTGKISGSQYVTINSGNQTGTVALSNAANDYTGVTIVNAGILQYNDLGAIAGSGRNVTVRGPGAVALGYVTTSNLLSRIDAASTGSAALTADSSEDLDFSSLTALSLGAVGTRVYTGKLTPNGTTYRLGGAAGTLTFNPSSYVSTNDLVLFGNGNTGILDLTGSTATTFGAITFSGGTTQNGSLTGTSYAANNAAATTVSANLLVNGSAGFTKSGAGTLTLNGSVAHTYTGATAVNRGTLIVDFANLASATDLINNGSALAMGGGTLQVKQKSGILTSQTFNGTTINAGASTITATNVGGSGTNTLTVGLGAITRNAGGVVSFTLPTSGQGNITTTTANETGGILGPWATIGSGTSLQYAANDGIGNIAGYTGATTTTQPADLSDVTDAGVNYAFGAGATMVGPVAANTLRYTGGNATLANAGNTITLNGLMNAGTANALTISGTGNLVIGANKELVIVASKNTSIAAPIVDNGAGASSLVYSGASGVQLTLSGTNSYSGGTTVASGTLYMGLLAPSSALGTGPVTVLPGAILGLDRNTLANRLYITDARIEATNGYASDVISGRVTLGGTVTLNAGGQAGTQVTGDMDGSGSIVYTGTRTDAMSSLSGTNTYTGSTTISGILRISKRVSLYGADTASWNADHLIVTSGSTAVFPVGGTGQFTSSDIQTLAAIGSPTGGFAGGSFICLDTASGNFASDAVIGDPNGGANMLGVAKYGGNTLTLTGASTYSGKTMIYGGAISVSSFNSVATNPALGTVHAASSNLGAPTTVAGGTIVMGTNFYGSSTTLIYTGGGETTDRVIAFYTNGSNLTSTIDQSGTGLLKFTSDMTVGGRTNWTLALQGSTTGQGEFAGAVGGAAGNAVAKNGTGTWTLSGTNLYNGATTLNAGVLSVATISDVGLTPLLTTMAGSATVTASDTTGLAVGQTVNSSKIPAGATIASIVDGITFTLSSGTGVTAGASQASVIGTPSNLGITASPSGSIVFNGGTLRYTGANASTSRGFTINAGKTATFDVTKNNLTISGIVPTTTGALAKTGAGILSLSGANAYSGGTSVQTGVLTYLNQAARPATGITTVAAQATLGLGVNNSDYSFFNLYDVDNLFAGSLLNVTNDPASNVGIDTTAGDFTYFGSYASSTRGLNKLGANTLTLAADNTSIYTGTTYVTAGTLELNPVSGSALTATSAVENNATLKIAAAGQDVGAISGAGSTLVDAGKSLTATSIVQNTLTIGAGGSVTIRETTGAASASPVPEPGTWVLLGTALVGWLAFRRRR